MKARNACVILSSAKPEKARRLRGICAILSALSLTAPLGAATRADEIDLARAEVYVSANATVPEIEAAKLLLRAQRMVAGGTDTTNVAPKVATAWPPAGVVVGWQESDLLKPLNGELGLKPWREMKNYGDEIVQRVRGGVYILAGNAPECAYFAVADLLYRNGARFIHTGEPEDGFESGTYLEWMTALKAPAARRYAPVVARRTGFGLERWGKKTRLTDAQKTALNNFAVRNCTSPARFSPLQGGRARGTIGCESIQPPVAEFKRHPEWFPLVDGKRWRPAPGGWVTEGCWSSPGFADWVVDEVVSQYARGGGADMITDLCLTNSDGGPKCECPDCRKYRAQFPDESSWYWDYHARLSRRIGERLPGLYAYTFAYIHSLCFPKAGKSVVAHLDAIQYCPYQRCYVHPYANRDCQTNRLDMDRAEAWRQSGLAIGDFDYCYDVFQPSMNMPNWDITWDVVRYWKELNGARGIPSIYMEAATEPNGCGGKSRVSAYAVARALWDLAEAPADVHVRDFCRVGFGDAAEEMYAWYRACAQAWQGQKSHLTGTFNNPTGTARGYFTEELVQTGARAFAAAEAKIRARLVPAGTPEAALTREQNLARKQYATWKWEKKWAYDAWKDLRERALASSLTINVEAGDPSDAEFARMPAFPFRPHWRGDVDNAATLRVYRTADALRLRIETKNPNLRPVAARPSAGDDERAYMGNHVELFLQAPGSGDYYHLCVGEDGSRYDAFCKDAAAFTSSAWTSAVATADGAATYTVTVPWTIFGAGHVPQDGAAYKLLVDIGGLFPDPAKPGEMRTFFSGLPRVGFHDVAAGADLVIDANAGRRAGGL